MIEIATKAQGNKDALVICLTEEQVKNGSFPALTENVKKTVQNIFKHKKFFGAAGEALSFLNADTIVVLCGLGLEKELTPTSLRTMLRNVLVSPGLKKAETIEVVPYYQEESTRIAAAESIILGTYAWNKYIEQGKKKPKKTYILISGKSKGLDQAITICEGVNLTRDLINENADIANSEFMERTVRGIIKGKPNVKLTVFNKKELKAKGFGLHLAVNQGSPNEPKLIMVEYRGDPKSSSVTAIVGKGMTFDTGGLNHKPTGSIETMRMDMSGSAAVAGTLKNILALKPKKNVLFVMAMAENVTGSKSYKPGDVITGYAGKSVEVLNTDAEGRLVLADAISYVVKNFKVNRLIDIATLTGACVIALAHDHTGLMTNNDDLSRHLVHSSNVTDDPVWRLPIYPGLKDAVKSKIADIKNIGWPRAGGTITAAEFLRQFTDGNTWAHLDIAGTAFNEGDGRSYFAYGATGAGVRLLTHYLTHYA